MERPTDPAINNGNQGQQDLASARTNSAIIYDTEEDRWLIARVMLL